VVHLLGVCGLLVASCTISDLPSRPSDGLGASGSQVAGNTASQGGSAVGSAGGNGTSGGTDTTVAGRDTQGAGAGDQSATGGSPASGGSQGAAGDAATDGGAPATCAPACTGRATCQEGECVCPNGEMLCGNACIGVLSDAGNCGSCNTICNGTCNRGRCVTLSNLKITNSVGNVEHAADLAFSGNTVYFTSYTGDYVCSANADGTGIAVIASHQINARSLAVDATNVYWLNNGNVAQTGSVMKLSRLGGDPVELASGETSPLLLVIDGSYAYWSDSDGPIQKVFLSGTGVKSTVSTFTSAQQIRSLILAGSTLYWASAVDGGSLGSGTTAGASFKQLAKNIAGLANYKWVVKAGNYLYFFHLKSTSPDVWELAKTPTDHYELLPIVDVASGLYLAADDTAVYVGGNAGIVRVSLDGSSVTRLIDGTAYNLVVHDNNLFFSGNDTVVRVVSKLP
jgi:hypothetical protein